MSFAIEGLDDQVVLTRAANAGCERPRRRSEPQASLEQWASDKCHRMFEKILLAEKLETHLVVAHNVPSVKSIVTAHVL